MYGLVGMRRRCAAHLKVEGAPLPHALRSRHEVRLQLRELRHGALLGALLVDVSLQSPRKRGCRRRIACAAVVGSATSRRCKREGHVSDRGHLPMRGATAGGMRRALVLSWCTCRYAVPSRAPFSQCSRSGKTNLRGLDRMQAGAVQGPASGVTSKAQ